MTDFELTEFIAQKGHKLDLYTMKALLDLADWYYITQLSGDCYDEGEISFLIYQDGDMSRDPWRRYLYHISDGTYIRWMEG